MLRVLITLSISLFLACSSDSPSPTGPTSFAGKALSTESADDRQALNNVYEVLAEAAGGDIPFLKDGRWTSRSTLAKWHGVTVEDGRVVGLAFDYTKSRHTKLNKPVFQKLIQALSPLSELRRVYIHFQADDLTSSPEVWNRHHQAARALTWPAETANLRKLEFISIQGQPLNFTGPATQLPIKEATAYLPVDDSFWSMTQLEKLWVKPSQIILSTGEDYPEDFLYWIRDSRIEVPSEISQLVNLKKLVIGGGYDEVVVSLPETISQLTQLEELHIGPSTVQLPAHLSDLTNLQHLYITGHGQLPASWGQLASLKSLVVVSPQKDLEFDETVNPYYRAGLIDYDGYIHGPLPAQWGNLENLETLWFEVGEFGYLNGELPPEWGSLTKLKSLSLANHEFTGSIPPQWAQMASLDALNLQNNLLSGPLPPEIGDMTSLVGLHLNNNELSGAIPSEITKLLNLKTLNLSNNQFTGPLIDFSKMSSMEWLYLSYNQLSGTINGRHFPGDIKGIGLLGNNFSGSFPDLSHLVYLRSFSQSLDLGGLGYTDICPLLPPILREHGQWACYHM